MKDNKGISKRLALIVATAAVFIAAVSLCFTEGPAGRRPSPAVLPKADSLSETEPDQEAEPYAKEAAAEFESILRVVNGEGEAISLDEIPKTAYRGFLFKLNSEAEKDEGVKQKLEQGIKEGSVRKVHGSLYEAKSLDTISEMFGKSQLEYIEPDCYMELIGQIDSLGGTTANPAPAYPPADPEYTSGALWNLDMLNVQGAWEAGLDGDPYVYNGKPLRDTNVRVAVIDTGLYGTGSEEDQHEDLDYDRMYAGTNFVTDQDGTPDAHGHGTFVAGLIAAKAGNDIGVAGAQPGVEIVSEKVFDTGSAQTADVIAAIYAAVDDDHADVINMSLGGEYNERSLETACDYAVSQGVLVVASAGNDGVSTPNYPAAYDSVVGVASVNSSQARSTWSQYGRSVFVTAPGENVRSTFTGASDAYKTASGTSFSGPEVAALAAMCKSVYPDIDQDTFKQFLIDTSTDLGGKGYDDFYGWGLVDFTRMAQTVLASQVMPWYNITFSLSDEDGRAIDPAAASITVTAAEDISWDADPENGIEEAGQWTKGTKIDPEEGQSFRLHRGNYTYTVVVDGKYTAGGTFKTYAENQTVPVTLATAYELTLRTVDSQGNAVTGSAHSVRAQDGRTEVPKSESGHISVYDLASGIYTYEAAADGYEKAAGTFTVQRTDKVIDAVLYRAEELATVSFNVTEDDGETPVDGAKVTVIDESGVTIAAQEDGTFRLAKGAAYTAHAVKGGFETSGTEFTVGEDEVQTVALSIHRASNKITFNVVDESNKKIASAGAMVADAEGERIEPVPGNKLQFGLREGDYTYEVSAPGYTSKTGSFGVALDSYTITVVLHAVPSKVTFNVTDAETNETIGGAAVKVNRSDRLRVIEPSGPNTYMLDPGDYDYTVYKEEYQVALGTFTVAGEDQTIDVALRPSEASGSYAGGTGTEEDPYLIATEEQLRCLAEKTDLIRMTSTSAETNKKGTVEGCYKLVNDIELTGGTWLPIGNYENGSNWVAFGGEFDGDGHTVSGMQIGTNESPVTYDYQGFFGYVRGAYIHDLVVDGEVYLDGKSSTSGGSYAGGLVGGAYYLQDPVYTSGNAPATTIERCGNLADVTGRYAVGGIIGSAAGSLPSTGKPEGIVTEGFGIIIKDCYNKGDLKGMVNGSYVRQTGTGQVAAGKRVGGIVGSATGFCSIENCYSTGEVQTGATAGGIAGYAAYSRISNSYNSGLTFQHSNANGDAGTTGTVIGQALQTGIYHSYGLKYDENYSNTVWGMFTNSESDRTGVLEHKDMYLNEAFVGLLNAAGESETGSGKFVVGRDYPMLYWEVTADQKLARMPVIMTQPKGIEEADAYEQGSEAEDLTACIEEIAEEDGSVTWQWYVSDTNSFKDSKPAPKGFGTGFEAAYTPDTEETGVKYYFCVFTNRLGLDASADEASAVTEGAAIYVRSAQQAQEPVITHLNPNNTAAINLEVGAKQGTDLELSVTAKVDDGGTLSYQWYRSSTGSGAGQAVTGAVNNTYDVNTGVLGTSYYYVEVSNTTGVGNVTKKISDWIRVTVDPYTISNYQELASFRTSVNSGNRFSGQIVYLTDDIQMPEEVDWTPIGTDENPFMGTFMGGTGYAGSEPETIVTHQITGISINGDNHENEAVGLFGVVMGGTICDLQVGGHVTGQKNKGAGLLAGQILADRSTAASIENCGTLPESSVEGAYMIGGLVGYGGAALSNCANHADVYARAYDGNLGSGAVNADSKYAAGGVSGYQITGNMVGCYNTGTITVDDPGDDKVCVTRVGGAAGYIGYYSGVASCFNSGELKIARIAESQYQRGALYVGSLVGYLTNSNGVNNFYQEGTYTRGSDDADDRDVVEMRSAQFMKTDYFTDMLNTGTGNYSYRQFRSSSNGVPHLIWEDENTSEDGISSAEPYITKMTSEDFPDIMDSFKGTYFQNTTYIDPIIVWADTPDGGEMRYEWRMREKGDEEWQVAASGVMDPDENGRNAQAPITVDVSETGVFEYRCEIFNKRTDADMEPLEESMYTPVITITVKDAAAVMSLRDPQAENSAGNPWIIDTPEKMKFFADIVNGNETYRPMRDATFEGQYVELAADIDLCEYDNWVPVGSNTSTYNPVSGVFKGIFDGANHTITGLTINNPGRNDYNGLFGQARMATIRNLEVAGTVKLDSASAYGTGGVVGYGYGCFIENVVNRVNVTGAVNTGGIIGYAGTCKILDCENLGEVSMNEEIMNSQYGGHDIGGIAGFMFVSSGAPGAGIYNCFNNGTVAGGLYDGDYRIGAVLGSAGTGFTADEHLKYNYYRTGSIAVDDGQGTGFGGGSYEPAADKKGRCLAIDDTDSPKTAFALDTSDATAEHSSRWGNYKRTDIGDEKDCVHLVRGADGMVCYRIDTASQSAQINVPENYAAQGDEIVVTWQSKQGFTVSKVSWRITGSDELHELGTASEQLTGVTFIMPAGDVEFVVESEQDTTHVFKIDTEMIYNGEAAPDDAGSASVDGSAEDGAEAGETVEITLNPGEGYQVKQVSAADSYGIPVEISREDSLHYSFVMPAADVTVTVTLEDYGTAADKQAESLPVDQSAIHYRNPDERYATADLLYEVMVLSGDFYGIDDPWMTYELERWENPGLYQQTYSFADGSTHIYTGLDVAKWLRNRIGETIPAGTPVSFEDANGQIYELTYGDLTKLTYNCYDASGQPDVRGLPVLLYFGVDGVPNTNGAMGIVIGQESPDDDNAVRMITGLKRICVGADISSMQHVYEPYNDFDAICGGTANDKKGYTDLTVRIYRGGGDRTNKGTLVNESVIGLDEIEAIANADRGHIHRGYYSAYHYEDKETATANSKYTDYYEGYDLYKLLEVAGVPYEPDGRVQFFQTGMNGLENSWPTVNVSLGYLAGSGPQGIGDYSENIMSYSNADDSGAGPSAGTMTNVVPLLMYGKNSLPLVWSSGTEGVGYTNYNYRGPMIAFLPQNSNEGGDHVGTKAVFSCYLGLIEVYLGEEPAPVDKSVLENTVSDAGDILENTAVSEDGKDVDPADQWVTPDEAQALRDAIRAAQDVLDDEDAAQNEVNAAAEDLKAALYEFEKALKDGRKESETKQIPIYRLYNKKSGEHLWTAGKNEYNVLAKQYGWTQEGVAWYAPESGKGVFRLYNPKTGDHHYTSDTNEAKVLTTRHGWRYDNNAKPLFFSGGKTPVYRLYNKNLKRGSHHLTKSKNEYNTLKKYGWTQEGIAMKCVK